MITFKNKIYFVSPKSFRNGDIEFNIMNDCGQIVGTNFTGINADAFSTDADRQSFEEMILEKTMVMEFEMKFLREFKATLENWASLNISKSEIIDIMDANWYINPEVTAALLI